MKPFDAHASWHIPAVILSDANAYPVSARLPPSRTHPLAVHWLAVEEADGSGDGLAVLEGAVVARGSGRETGVGLGLCKSSRLFCPPHVSKPARGQMWREHARPVRLLLAEHRLLHNSCGTVAATAPFITESPQKHC